MLHYLWKVLLKSARLFSQTAIDTETYRLKMWFRLFYKMAAMTSSFDQFALIWNAHPLAYVRLFLESFVEIGPVVSPNGSGHTHRQTDRHTHTQTHRHTHRHLPFFLDTITIHLVNEMTKCKNVWFRLWYNRIKIIQMTCFLCFQIWRHKEFRRTSTIGVSLGGYLEFDIGLWWVHFSRFFSLHFWYVLLK